MLMKDLILEGKSSKKINAIITLIYFFINLLLVVNHEHWMDEAQAFVISKNLSLVEMFKILCTEGHPSLWFLVIMPFAKLGISYYYFSFISLIVMTIAVFIFMKDAPFSLIIKIGILFSSVFLFYNPVVCRSYSLIALIIILISKEYKNKLDRPVLYGILILLLSQTHVLVFGLVIGLIIDLLIEFFNNKNRKSLISIIIAIFGLLCAIMEIYPRTEFSSGIDTSTAGIIDKLNIANIIDGMKYFAYISWGWTLDELFYIPYFILIILLISLFIFISKNKAWKKNFNVIMIAVCSFAVFFGVTFLVYKPHTQMASIAMMILLFIMWQLYKTNKNINIRVPVLLLLVITSALTFIVAQSSFKFDLFGNYSTSEMTAKYIENNLKENSIILIEDSVYDSAVYAYVESNRKDIAFFDMQTNDSFIFHQMGIDYKIIDTNQIIEKSNELKGDIYYLTNSKKTCDKLILLYTSCNENSVWSENYFLYKVER